MLRRRKLIATAGLTAMSALVVLHPLVAYADCYCNLSEPVDVIVQNWQTFKPKVTAMHSLNAYLANQLGEAVYYVPTLDALPNVKNRMYNCTDFRGTNQKFAAIYDGFFDVECQDVLMKKPNGEYTKVPEMMQGVAPGSERELNILGYDYLLTKEAIRDVVVNETALSATYQADRLDMVRGSVDIRTAIMDIYKAIGQEILDTTYVFTDDPTLSLETSPIQNEIHLQMAKDNSIDTSAGKGYVFTTRTNPDLYWDRAKRDHIIMDNGGSSTSTGANGEIINPTASRTLTLAEFCSYAYNIMHIYGEPVMTTSEKSLLLQLYGTSIPYTSVDGYSVEAIENFIAKGIISPDDDASNLSWNEPIKPAYMLTMLMRIADLDSRMTYKDVNITIDPTLLDNHWYAADIMVESSPILEMEEDSMYAKVATYVPNRFTRDKVISDLGAYGKDSFYIQNHLVVQGNDGVYYPLGTLVMTTVDRTGNDSEDGKLDGTVHLYTGTGGQVGNTAPFAECLGWEGSSNGKLLINVYMKTVAELIQDDGTYHIHMQEEDGSYSSGYLTVTPGKRADESTPNRGTNGSYRDDDDDEWDDWEDEEEDWEDEDEEEDWYDLPGIDLAQTETTVIMITIEPGSESDIVFESRDKSVSKRLSELMLEENMDEASGYGYLIPGDATDIHVRKVSDTIYQVEGTASKEKLKAQIKGNGGSKITPIEGFVQRDAELIVSTEWLKEAGFIVSASTEKGNDNVIVLKSKYNEIYLDRSKKVVVAGTTVYTLQNLAEQEIFMDAGGGEWWVNFRAVLGWTGDFLLFKNSENGTVTVSVKEYPKNVSRGNNSVTGDTHQRVEMKKIDDTNPYLDGHLFDSVALSQTIQSSSNRLRVNNSYDRYSVSMTSTYPFANWLVYSRGALEQTDYTDSDWLFVFKPKRVKLRNAEVVHDDTAARQMFTSLVGSFEMSDDLISIWAYPLYKSSELADRNPEGMNWDDAYGWTYTPQKIDDLYDFLDGYFSTETAYGGNGGKASNVLPMVVMGGTLQCVNFNSYSINQGGQEVLLEYGTLPVVSLRPPLNRDGTPISTNVSLRPVSNFVNSLAQNAHHPITGALLTGVGSVFNLAANTVDEAMNTLNSKYYCGVNTSTGKFEMRPIDDTTIQLENCKVYPTVVSPALWVMDLQTYTFEDIKEIRQSSRIFTGTDAIEIVTLGNGDIQVWQGSTQLDIDEFKKKKFLRIRSTAASGTQEYLFSMSQLESFTLNSTGGESLVDKTMDVLGVGRASSHIDVIDWDEFTLRRLLEDFEFGVAITMVVVLYIIPRICLFVFLMLLALGCIQNVKLVQWFSDRFFDPYKFLTMGRRNVHTFRPGIAFRNSILAMAVFALFMDGTIIHVFEWIIQFMAYIFSYH